MTAKFQTDAGFLIYTYVLTDAFQFRLRFKT